MKKYLNVAMIIAVCLLVACSQKEVDSAADTSPAREPNQPGGELTNQTAPMADEKKADDAKNTTYTQIDWEDLIPDDDLHALDNPPAYLADIEDGSADDSLPSQLKNSSAPAEDRYQQALTSKQIRPEFNGRHVRIPGYIVPLEFDEQQTMTTFFLVPYFGACTHMPPPPPNQIIHAEYEQGTRLDALYLPFWIEGTLSTTLVENDMATAAYSVSVAKIVPYTEG